MSYWITPFALFPLSLLSGCGAVLDAMVEDESAECDPEAAHRASCEDLDRSFEQRAAENCEQVRPSGGGERAPDYVRY